MSELSAKPVSTKELAANLTTRLERNDPTALAEVNELRSRMSPREYGSLLKQIREDNDRDRQLVSKLPKVIIYGSDEKPRLTVVGDAPEPQSPPQSKAQEASAPSAKAPERDYSNTNAYRERMFREFGLQK